MAYFWFSFSKGGKNQGVINTEAETVEAAQKKVVELGIVPEYDHVESSLIPEPELELDVLITPEKMRAMEYESRKYKDG